MVTPKQVGKRAWRREIARGYRFQRQITQRATKMLELIEERPFPVRLLAMYIGYVLSDCGEITDALRELENIIVEDPRYEVQ